MKKNICLLIDAIESNFTPDLPYYALEIVMLTFQFIEKKLIFDILPFVLKWMRLVLLPTVAFPALSPIFFRFSKFVAGTETGIPPSPFQNPNQRTAILGMIAAATYNVQPYVSAAIILISLIII